MIKVIIGILFVFSELSLALETQDNFTFIVKDYGVTRAKGLMQSKEQEEFFDSAPRSSYIESKSAIPGQFSMRNMAGPVENQGACGSCWDFSLTTALRGSHIMSGSDPGRLSFNYLLNCAKNSFGCGGGTFAAAKYFIYPSGAPQYGSDGNYTEINGACVAAPVAASAINYRMLGTFGRNPSFKDIAYVIGVLHQPVTVDVSVDKLWESYGGGVYNGCTTSNPFLTNHMVVIEGYSCESSVDSNGYCKFDWSGDLPKGVGTWIIRNSWGKSWGDQGYITTKATDKNGRRCNSVASKALHFVL